MKKEDFIPYLTKFIIVKLNDGTYDAGYISNPDDFLNDNNDTKLVLLNGLLYSEVSLDNIIDIKVANREDTVKIPIVGYEDDTIMDPIEIENIINELYDNSLLDDLDIDLDSLLKNDDEI